MTGDVPGLVREQNLARFQRHAGMTSDRYVQFDDRGRILESGGKADADANSTR